MATDMTVSKEILRQLGGNHFVMMTGAKHLTGDTKVLSFKLPQGTTRNKATYVRVTLTPMDTYTVEFLKVRGLTVTPVSTHEDIYCDQLRSLFERQTGLRTSLGTMGR